MVNNIASILSSLRALLWWNHLAPPVLAVFYFFLWKNDLVFVSHLAHLALFMTSFAGSAAFGYWVNDWMDIEPDRLAGKPNAAAKWSSRQRVAITLVLLAIGWLPWVWLPFNFRILGLLLALYTALVIYAVTPFRFKDRAILGIFCDLLYGHLLPVFIAVAAFSALFGGATLNSRLLWLIALILALKGMRNILEHQIKDRKNDALAGMNTFVRQIGALRSGNIMSYVVVPLELALLAVLSFSLGQGAFISFALFCLAYWFLLYTWGCLKGSPREWLYRSWYIANDYYESWLPLTFLALACIQQPINWLLLLAHLLIFPGSFLLPVRILKQIQYVWSEWTN